MALEFMNSPQGDAAEALPIQEEAVTPEPEAAPEPTPEPTPEPEAVIEQKPAAEPGHIPISALLDEREKRQELEKRLKEMEARQPAQPRPQAPNILDDPEGFATAQQQNTNDQILNVKLDISEDLARDKHGDAKVEEAVEWLKGQPKAFAQEILGQRNPYETLIKAHQKDQMTAGVEPSEFTEFKAWKAAQAAITAAPAATIPTSPTPPRSIASAVSAGGPQHVATGAGTAYDQTFRK